MNCGKCKYFKTVDAIGECRRFPPNQDGEGSRTVDEFPIVKKDFWCGEYKKKGAKK